MLHHRTNLFVQRAATETVSLRRWSLKPIWLTVIGTTLGLSKESLITTRALNAVKLWNSTARNDECPFDSSRGCWQPSKPLREGYAGGQKPDIQIRLSFRLLHQLLQVAWRA